MPRCQCGATTCACAVIAGDGIEVSGVGSASQPYKVTNQRGDALARLQVIDTDSVDLTLIPVVPGDDNTAYTLQADATVSMLDLTDVDGSDFPNTGDVPTWNGTEWVFTPATSAPVSGVWGTAPLDDPTYGPDSLRGQETYLDSAGKIRTRPQIIAGDVNVNDPPSVYPIGMSIMSLSAPDGVTLGWGFSCTVVTFRRASTDSVAAQWLYQNHTTVNPPVVKYRSGNAANSPAWSAWLEMPAVSGVWGTAPLDKYGVDSTYGQESYLDSAGKIRTRPQVIPTANALAITDSPTLYPVGLSIMAITGADATAKGWPASGTIVTYRRIQTSGQAVEQVAAQWFYQNHTPTATPPLAQYRNGNGAATPIWSSWLTVSPLVTELAANVDLNTLTNIGVFSQSQTAEATTALNYPVGQAGLLEVEVNPATSMVWQRYTVYASAGPVGNVGGNVYTRGSYNGTWQPWVLLGGNDTGWVNFTSALTSGTARYRLVNGTVHIQVDGAAATVSGTVLTVSTVALPAAIRPTANVRSGGYFTGFPGTLTMDTAGNVTALQQSGANRTSVAGYLAYVI